jgi:hypothetical protein
MRSWLASCASTGRACGFITMWFWGAEVYRGLYCVVRVAAIIQHRACMHAASVRSSSCFSIAAGSVGCLQENQPRCWLRGGTHAEVSTVSHTACTAGMWALQHDTLQTQVTNQPTSLQVCLAAEQHRATPTKEHRPLPVVFSSADAAMYRRPARMLYETIVALAYAPPQKPHISLPQSLIPLFSQVTH